MSIAQNATSNGYISWGAGYSLGTGSSNLAIALLFNPDTTDADYSEILGIWSEIDVGNSLFSLHRQTGNYFAQFASGTSAYSSGTQLSAPVDDTWNSMIFEIELGTAIRFWQNLTLIDNTVGIPATRNSSTLIDLQAFIRANGGTFSEGRIAEIAIINRTTTAQERTDFDNLNGAQTIWTPSELLFYSRLTNLTDIDDIDGGLTGTAVNSPLSYAHPLINYGAGSGGVVPLIKGNNLGKSLFKGSIL